MDDLRHPALAAPRGAGSRATCPSPTPERLDRLEVGMTPPPLMIFAAGFGTRMGALTAERPKPLIEVGGRPLIDHVA